MEGDVFLHTTMVTDGLPKDSSFELAVAAVLHDMSKPETRTESVDSEGNKKISFIDHEDKGAEACVKILTRLKFPNKQIERIAWLIKNHLRIFSFPTMRQG